MNDPLGDMLTRIRNASMRGKSTTITPASKLRRCVLEVLADEGVPRIALRTIRIVDVLGDDDQAGVDGLLDSFVKRVRHGDRRNYGVLAFGNRCLDQVRVTGSIAIGVHIGQIDIEDTSRLFRTELHRQEERRAGAAMLDEGDLDLGRRDLLEELYELETHTGRQVD